MKRSEDARQTPYGDIDPDKMILRDHLALDRTVLANERTVLAYMRTAIGVAITGIMLIKLFTDSQDVWWGNVGRGLLIASGLLAVLGVVRYQSVRRRLARIFQRGG